MNIVLIAAIYECIVIISICVLLTLILKKYYEKRHKLTLYLFLIYLNFTIAVFFSFLSKVIVLTTEINYVYNEAAPEPNTPLYWILLRIVDFRFTMIFASIGVIYSYILKVNVFERDFIKWQKLFVFIFGSYTILFSLFIYIRGNTLLDAINFLNVLFLASIIYFPFMKRSMEIYKAVDNPIYKKAFLSLAIMCLTFILVFLFVLLDRITILLGGEHFSIFYFLIWISVLIGFVAAYLGYFKPKSSEKN